VGDRAVYRQAGAGVHREKGVAEVMKTEQVKHCAGGMMLAGGVLCVAIIVAGSTVRGGTGLPTWQDTARRVTMIDPFELRIVWVSQSPSSPGDNDRLRSSAGSEGPLIRIPDRPVVRSVFKPLP
jgi:hypothetical protein